MPSSSRISAFGCHIDRNILGDIARQIARIAAPATVSSTSGDRRTHTVRTAEAALRGAHEQPARGVRSRCKRSPRVLNLGIHAVLVLRRRCLCECTVLPRPARDIIARQTQDLANLQIAPIWHNARRRRIASSLCSQEDGLAVLHCRFQCANRHHSAHIKVDDHIGNAVSPRSGSTGRRLRTIPLSSLSYIRFSLHGKLSISFGMIYLPGFVKALNVKNTGESRSPPVLV